MCVCVCPDLVRAAPFLTWSPLGLLLDALYGIALAAAHLHALTNHTKAASTHHTPDEIQVIELIGIPGKCMCVCVCFVCEHVHTHS